MSLVIKLEKIKFISDEMQLTFQLAKHAPDDFVARMLARHIIIRASDFIALTRRLNRTLRHARFRTNEFNLAKEVYAKNFNEYFRTTRDRLGAHVQDLDYGKRLELWNDIEVLKLSFFVDGAQEIYKILLSMGIPGLPAYSEPLELNAQGLRKILTQFQNSIDKNHGVEIGTDPLAMTRANTSVLLNLTPIHLRAGQLSLIRRWIKLEREFLKKIDCYPNTARILKARLLTDIVSFFDCLVTRPLASTAPQYMEGLNTLLTNEGHASIALDRFLTSYEYKPPLRNLREMRDRIGAHLEDNDTQSLSLLLSDFDKISTPDALKFFDTTHKIFEKVCREIFFLKMYAIDGQRMRTVVMEPQSVVPFDENNLALHAPSFFHNTADHSIESYQLNLGKWLGYDELEKSEAQHFFWNAFLYSPTIEKIIEREDFGYGSYRNEFHDWRSVGDFILNILTSEADHDITLKILQLLGECRSSDPYLLSEIIIRYSICNSATFHELEICYYLGELCSYPHNAIKVYLNAQLQTKIISDVQFQAIVALFKIFVRSEGIIRINQKSKRYLYHNEVGKFLAAVNDECNLFISLVLGSQFCLIQLGHFASAMANEYSMFKTTITAVSQKLLPSELYMPISETITRLLDTHDFIGASCLLAENFKMAGNNSFSELILRAACDGTIIIAHHDHAVRNLACCFLRIHNYKKSLEIAEYLETRNPDDINLQMFTLSILGETPNCKEQTMEKICSIRKNYVLPHYESTVLTELEKKLNSP